MTNISNYFFVITAIILGAIVVKEDLAERRIRNKWIILGFKIGFFYYSVLIIWAFIGFLNIYQPVFFQYFKYQYFFNISLNTILSGVISYFFWRYRIWPAGDAKLFTMFSFLLPLRYYSNDYFPYFPSIDLFINIFIPAFISVTVPAVIHSFVNIALGLYNYNYSVFKIYLTGLKKVFYEQRNNGEILAFASSFTLTFIFIPTIRNQVSIFLAQFFSDGLLIFAGLYFTQMYLYKIVNTTSKQKYAFIFLIIFLGLFLFDVIYFYDQLISALKITAKIGFTFAFLLILFKKMSNFYINQKETLKIDVNELSPQMIISEEIINEVKNNKTLFSKVGDLSAEGLSSEQIKTLKPWLIKTDKRKVNVYKTIPFAPWIFAGVIITIILKQSIIHFILKFI